MRGIDERRRWDALMASRHYLPYRGLFGRSLRHVAVRGETWLALPGWQAGAFKAGVRDAWIGRTREQQFSRMHLVASNARFAVLDGGRVPNLASRAPGPRLRRLSRDVRAAQSPTSRHPRCRGCMRSSTVPSVPAAARATTRMPQSMMLRV